MCEDVRMRKRATVTFEEEIYRQLEERARRHGRSVNDEIRAAVERALSDDRPPGLLRLAGIVHSASAPASSMHDHEFRDSLADSIVRESLGRKR